jgi:probable F420-dependent oxidoreductase
MKINFQMPPRAVKHYETWIGERELADLAVAAEDAGFDAVSMTDHPFPSDDWLAVGGHHSFDPFVALSFMAARTSRIRMLTNLVISAYRDPYLAAKSVASLDLLSGGRLTLGLGAGYQAAEFAALGADFEDRGRRFDAALAAMRAAWTGETVTVTDGYFPADGHTALPRPAQRPHPPVWIGGNSRRARRRAAQHADGWMPFQQPPAQAAITGTDALTTLGELAERVAELDRMRLESGRPDPLDVCFAPHGLGSSEQLIGFLEERSQTCAEAGVTWITWESKARSVDQCLGDIAAVGAHLRRTRAAEAQPAGGVRR